MIELNPEQRQAVEEGEPVRIIDPATHDAYVLVRAEVYERLAEGLPRPDDEPPPGISPQILRSQQAYWRELPELLKDKRKRGKYVAYHGEERVVSGTSYVEAYQQCFRRGLKLGEFYVGRVKEDPDGIPPWGTLHCDWGFYEVTEGTPPDPA